MVDIVLELDDRDRAFVDARAAELGCTAADAVLAIIRDARRERALDRFEEIVADGFSGDNAVEATPEFWAEQRRRLDEQLAGRKATA